VVIRAIAALNAPQGSPCTLKRCAYRRSDTYIRQQPVSRSNRLHKVPDNYAQIVVDLHGPKGKEWLNQLPELLSWCEDRWSIAVGAPFAPLSYNYVATATQLDGNPAVLKLGVPTPDFTRERDALLAYGGSGAVELLASYADAGAMLLECAEPGTQLVEHGVINDAQATSIAAGVMRRLWRPVPETHQFQTVADWANGLQRLHEEFSDVRNSPFQPKLVDRAEGIFRELLASMDEPVLLHGDLHHFNILASGREPWLAIDPHGVIGEPAYETGALLRNPMPMMMGWRDLKWVLERRILQLADDLSLDRKRIHGWGIAQAVLSGWWSYEDHGKGWEPSMHIAELLSELVI
jgi:streptomycin 6-kinase